MAAKKKTRGRPPDSYIPIGNYPPAPFLAWKWLHPRAKALLQARRMMGEFGGRPGKAPYWHVQEVGERKANVEALWYIRHAVDAWSDRANLRVTQWLKGY